MVALVSKMTKEWWQPLYIHHISFHCTRNLSTGMEELGVPHRLLVSPQDIFPHEEPYRKAERRPQYEMLNAYLRWEKFVGASDPYKRYTLLFT